MPNSKELNEIRKKVVSVCEEWKRYFDMRERMGQDMINNLDNFDGGKFFEVNRHMVELENQAATLAVAYLQWYEKSKADTFGGFFMD